MNTLDQILSSRLVAIFRGISSQNAAPTAKALYQGSIRAVEITFNQSLADPIGETVRAIEEIRENLGEQMLVGAGTVLTPEQAEAAAKAGASFVLSPDTNLEVIRKTKELGLVSIPGAFTPTEIMTAYRAGADIVKLFPASILPLDYVKAIRGPISHVPLMAVGGVGKENLLSFFAAGFTSAGIGSNLVRKDMAAAGDWDGLRALALEYTSQLH